MPRDWRHSIVDLTNGDDDSDDSDKGSLASLPMVMGPSNTQHVASPTGSRLTNAPRPVPAIARQEAAYPLFPQSTSQPAALPYTNSIASQHTHVGGTSFINLSTSSGAVTMGNSASKYVPMPRHVYAETSASDYAERAPKRMRMDAAGTSSTPSTPSLPMPAPAYTQPITQQANTRHQNGTSIPPPFRNLAPSGSTPWKPGTEGRPPSVQDINRALKTKTRPTPVLGNLDTSTPRTLHISRKSPSSPFARNGAGPDGYVGEPVPLTTSHTQEEARNLPQAPMGQPTYTSYSVFQDARRPEIAMSATSIPGPAQVRPPSATEKASSRPSYFADLAQEPRDEDNDSVISDMSEPPEPVSKPREQTSNVTPHSSRIAPPTMPAHPQPTPGGKSRRKNGTCQFDMAQDHFLIFLKEVKQYKWSDITAEYNKYMPHRQYHSLQSRYSTLLNKRDRSQDPSTLILPPQFASEANIDWANIHPLGPSSKPPRPPLQHNTPRLNFVRNPPTRLQEQVSSRLPIQQAEHDYSSGADSAPRRERTRRAQRVNYTWPKQRGVAADDLDNTPKEAVRSYSSDEVFARSESPPEEDAPLPSKAVAVDNIPVDVEFEVEDAKVGLSLRRKGLRGTSTKLVPYLSASQRSSIQHPTGLDWDQLSSRDWQNEVLHVDFSTAELRIVEKVVSSMKKMSRSRHATLKRQLRETLRSLNEPKMIQLVDELRRQLPLRDRSSIEAFVQDARAGTVAEQPRVKRLAAARPGLAMSSIEKPSTMSMIRERELGRQSRRGWQAASKPLTYQVKNKYMDSLGPAKRWTGASSDIHTLAWAPDGEHFAAGAVAVDDPDSIQYNRPNNLLFGNMTHGTIHELAEHYKKRERTESGANSSHAMFASQDPKLYTTVSAVAFSTTGRFMYSAGYDEHIGIWHTDTDSVQPILGAKLNVRAQIDILSVNRTHEGILATAARSVDEKAIRLLKIDAEEPSRFEKRSFHSNKAVSRADLKILPTALQFEPKYGNYLLAGFGANTRESALDMTGDLCLWDIETQTSLYIHGSNKNVFDVEFNPNRTNMPLFAVGCVAGASVNRGTRSLIRLYDVNGPEKFSCPLEFECKALDMNDVVWCPYDEHLIAAGCTDGRAYIWDIRWPDDPLRVLSHGESLMPLQEGVKHEVTDTGVRFLSWGENATRLYSGSSDGVVKVWDVTRAEENTFIKDLITTDSGIMSGAFSADYSKLLVGEVNGSVNLLEVGRNNTSLKETERLRYMPYEDDEQDEIQDAAGDITRSIPDSGIAEANHLLDNNQLQLVPMGSLPIRQAIQGPNYTGPFDNSPDAPFLRAQAQIFQQSLIVPPGPQCNIPACVETPPTITSEQIGDSGRSLDRVPDELRRQWKTDVSKLGLVPGRARCTSCGRPARPSPSDDVTAEIEGSVMCERCSFSCFRCAATNSVKPATTTLSCGLCGGVWDIGVLGYECVREPHRSVASVQNVPSLRRWGREAYEEYLEEDETGYGDDDNALSEWFLGLGI
ncbi:WD40 repeat protein [Pyrenophora tritici-repentis]|uniref:WD40 repeat n=1 Tax=Pyrenophora tritici-repentis TaxID=45151 RepID=A0A2W1H0D4_9PLEO|nr:WD40 repeat [Pyrenophora tritici-repentis]KAI1576236.1 hypothetical protein PtrEW7m1_006296 [Pyrenophora tritici-repentis]KAI1592125.1 hypothetical protein PtrEW13061_004023 [Pyrenophora tritici-repentis]KAI1670606.1 WD40 repeat [Pyrenophora tritici-repentis]KAI1682238.1 WD40 repeat [Pyrenophora tritici-repentis]